MGNGPEYGIEVGRKVAQSNTEAAIRQAFEAYKQWQAMWVDASYASSTPEAFVDFVAETLDVER